MKKKKKSSGGGSNWMDTYGDMVTLLLCFFVLLYSISTIEEEAWKALVMTFNPAAIMTSTETPGGEGPDASADEGGVMPQEPNSLTQAMIEQDIENLYQAIKQYVQDENLGKDVHVTKGDGKVFVTFSQTAIFDGDSYVLRTESLPILEAMGSMMSGVADSIDEVRILGHTAQASANRPNNVVPDRLLSAERAANALAYIQMHCTVDPAKLISEGYGQWRPVASNATEETRSRNRRVEMIVSGRNLDQELAEGIRHYEVESVVTDEPAEEVSGEPVGEDSV